MWKFVSAGATNVPAQKGAKQPYLHTLNNHQGRQTWEFDPDAGTPEERARVEELRANFTKNRQHQKHSADELLRLQSASKIAAKKHAPPAAPLPEGNPTPERVEQHLNGAISFYECLQASGTAGTQHSSQQSIHGPAGAVGWAELRAGPACRAYCQTVHVCKRKLQSKGLHAAKAAASTSCCQVLGLSCVLLAHWAGNAGDAAGIVWGHSRRSCCCGAPLHAGRFEGHAAARMPSLQPCTCTQMNTCSRTHLT